MFEKSLVRQCAPTMAGIKTGSLFSYEMNQKQLNKKVKKLNKILEKHSIKLLNLCYKKGKGLLYMYRPEMLKKDLLGNETKEILAIKNYPVPHMEKCIEKLTEELKADEEFPHEIGLFLGYPPVDVKGFIKHNAKCEKCVGLWKVYGDVEESQKNFVSTKTVLSAL